LTRFPVPSNDPAIEGRRFIQSAFLVFWIIEERGFNMAQARKLHKHGILYLHGAGMPEDKKTLSGDPLATVGDGLVDHFQGDGYISKRHWMAVKTDKLKDDATQTLELDVFLKGEKGKPDRREYVIRMGEVLWKPLARKLSLPTYLPLVWQWALAFQSNLQRQDMLKEYSTSRRAWRQTHPAQQPKAHSEEGNPKEFSKMYDESGPRRHRIQMWSRIGLAGLGLLISLLVWPAGEVYKRQSWMQLKIDWLLTDQVTTTIIATSLVAAVLLVLLAFQERSDSDKRIPHGRLHLLAIVLTTAWLSIFLLPILLVGYYLDRVVTLGVALVLAGAFIFVALNGGELLTRVALLIGIAIVIWFLTRSPIRTQPARLSSLLRGDMQNRLANQITMLMVTGGAPWVILLISVLELLSFLPFVGDNLKQLAKTISEMGYWDALKDIYLILTDSSRSAAARYMIEKAITELDKKDDLDSIHIFAHSLGTVVAYDTLVQIGRGNGVFIKRRSKKGSKLYDKIKTLVTFGCPLNKIRTLGQFQGEDVMSGFDYDRFGVDTTLPNDLGEGDFRWINVYSPHDFVSDACVAYSGPTDKVHPKEFTAWSANDIATAHGIYWVDKGFWNTALEAMGIVYPRDEMVRIEELPEAELHGYRVEQLRERGIVTQTQLEAQLGESTDPPPAQPT
jgi:hypothetical protein